MNFRNHYVIELLYLDSKDGIHRRYRFSYYTSRSVVDEICKLLVDETKAQGHKEVEWEIYIDEAN